MSTNFVPSDDELKDTLVALRAQNPTLGIAKLHALLLSTNPTWSVSEKRTKKISQAEGLVLSTPQNPKGENGSNGFKDKYPSSKLIEGLDVSKYTPNVEVKQFGGLRGKGLVATAPIAQGEEIWKEDPWVLAPEWALYNLQESSVACGFCSTPLRDSSLVVPCPSACPAKFCGRLCLTRSRQVHPLLCSTANPASVPLVRFAKRAQWMSLHALAQTTARLLLSYQQDEATFREDWEVYQSLAQLSLEERARSEWMKGMEPDREAWKKSYELYIQAFRDPQDPLQKKKLERLLKKPLPDEFANELFTYDGFLRGLGRMSLNVESHGGLYILHSHMNHSCDPNVSARHLEQRSAIARITAVALADIAPGEELCITYVNPKLDVRRRRKELYEWGFGTCRCDRCVREEGEAGKSEAAGDADDLERELKAGLGVM